ncbi:DNA polymerase IV [Balneolaceae bacterium ANBcel3]|nr:DNA polymerase IV [Balneolaceae bacterium ANBcel3]
MRKIIHIDMDAFFASVEQRDNPQWKNKPVVVGGDPRGRGVVAAASYEARIYGVHSAMPSSHASRLCPDLIFVRPRFEAYKKESEIIRAIFSEYTDLIEPLSLDEAYLDVTENKKENPSATLIAREIKDKIHSNTGLTASAGISYNKFLAKIASDVQKPNGITLIEPEKALSFIAGLPIGSFYGVGKATEKKMHQLGIKNGADLRNWSEFDLMKEFGKAGSFYYHIARGMDDRPVKTERIAKSIGKEKTFQTDIDSVEWLMEYVDTLSHQVAERLQKEKTEAKTVTLKIRYDNFEVNTRSKSPGHPISTQHDIASLAKLLLLETEAGKRNVRLIGVTVSGFNREVGDSSGGQLMLPFFDS